MNLKFTLIFTTTFLFLKTSMIQAQMHSQLEEKINQLIGQMTIEEKVGQMTQINIDLISKGDSIYQLQVPHEIDADKLKTAILKYHIGSVLNAPGYALPLSHWNKVISQIQEVAMSQSRLKIPVLYGIDAIHGANYLVEGTLFPQPIAQAATWNPDLVAKAAFITAYETRAMGIPWNFSPVLDVMRQPLWVRNFETYGEDVLLCNKMGLAAVQAYQGEDISKPTSVAACMKHFVGYSWPSNGKDRVPAYIPETQLREYMLPPFEAAINAGAKTLMVNSAELNGVPVHASKEILTDLLRNELGFEGVVVTDWEDIIKLHLFHRTSPTLKDAVKSAVLAGIDMSMVPNDYNFSELLVELVNEGEIKESRLDESVRRILRLKLELGLFENPFRPSYNYNMVGSQEFLSTAASIAEESFTLLKNENAILPLSKSAKVLVTGPMANSLSMVNGAWSRTWQGTDESKNSKNKLTVKDALMQIGQQVNFELGCTIDKMEIAESWENSVIQSDVIIACMGELPGTEKPGDINDLTLDSEQLDYIKKLSQYGKPIVLVLFSSRPRIIKSIEPLCAAIMMAYYPSEEGTLPLAKVIFGDVNPSGKLPYTYPKHVNNLLTYDHKITEKIDQDYGLTAFDPQFEFGSGLSYTHFQYSNFKLSGDQFSESDTLQFTVEVANVGKRKGKEVVQLFISDKYASITPPAERLRAFKKVEIDTNQSLKVEFNIPISSLAFVGRNNKWILEEGEFTARIQGETIKFYLNK